ncbi:thermonuclease family protein [Marinobacterium sediminicola]|uniref:Endonuclease YncB, thermonuclease family n=1 Tax=Marinobacterium sediminicola TaxID=518898 RepID=A0ABY1S264_9GAMM|nr:thermonuclease family protein [Marinobacterium sediminicola]ULG69519.1 thermonuclease family protein [Marinobacterium sediminicola]SMR75671.1 Endonuclease YncB, thermonuclease family [Marinobacterium sediminicola]
MSAFFVSARAVCLLVFFLLFPALTQAACSQLPGGFSAHVDHVYDGDTLRLQDGRKVRLVGVNTPEMGRDGRADEPYAREARNWLKQRADRQRVYLLPGSESRDRYGRLLAHLYLPDGRLAAEWMVREGLGYALAMGSDERLADCLFEAEQEARQKSERLWQQSPVAAGDVSQSGFAVVRGRVTRITPTRRGLYIDLDQHLALFLSEDVVDEVGADLWQTGQVLEARGWLVDRLQRQQNLAAGQQRWLLRVMHKYHIREH